MQAPIPLKAPGWVGEFRAFIARGNVVDLAVGIIIGVAFTAIVNSLVKDIFNPLIGMAIGGIDFSNIFIPLNGEHYNSLADAQRVGAPTVNIGVFINSIINFIIIAFAVFWLVKLISKVIHREKAAAPPARSEVLLEEIRDILKQRA
ncbi:MAG: large conductance mechanosensitive channel protein MscL [Alphaproteobacteria bacterium]|nr:large conductance mechanosensitive channel protein MscL [Alphaproteobacteria bacterium]